MNEVAEKPTYTVAEYNEVAAALALLNEKYGKAVFDVTTKKGLDLAKAARAELRGYRVNLEATRKAIKAPALNHCRLIDAEAKEITEKLSALEVPIAQQIEVEESRKEAEKQAKLQAEINRVQNLHARIAKITAKSDLVAPNAAACQQALTEVNAMQIGEDFEELQEQAKQARELAIYRLQNLFTQYQAAEAEAEQIRIDRAKLAQLEAESAARRAEDDRKAAEERDRLKREQDEILEVGRRQNEARQEQERAQQEEAARQVREAQKAEQARLDAIKAALERKQAEAEEAERKRLAAVNAAEERVRNAAPLLLEACKQALPEIPITHAAFQVVRDAIAVAEEPKQG